MRGLQWLICVALVCVPIQVFSQGEIRQAIPHGVTTPWVSHIRYAIGDAVVDRGGIWQALAVHSDSRPVSGNTNWTLVGGTPYVDTTVTANQLNALLATPITLVPAPGAGYVAHPVYHHEFYAASTRGFSYDGVDPKVGLQVGGTTYQENADSIDDSLADAAVFNPWTDASNSMLVFQNQPIRLTCTAASLATGVDSAGVAINSGGTGYVAGETVTIDGGGDVSASVVIDTVNGSGVVTAMHLITSGRGYSTGTNRATTGGTGTGFTVNLTTVGAGNGTVTIRVYYQILAVS